MIDFEDVVAPYLRQLLSIPCANTAASCDECFQFRSRASVPPLWFSCEWRPSLQSHARRLLEGI